MRRVLPILLGVVTLALVAVLILWAPRGSAGPAGPTGPQGLAGTPGAIGASGIPGVTGPSGAPGTSGEQGARGPTGATGSGSGAAGPAGPLGPAGAVGPVGAIGPAGASGTNGTNGATGADGSGEAALFYAMPGDNGPIALGDPVLFPQDGPSTTSIVTRDPVVPGQFVLQEIGVYRVTFQVPVIESGQLVLRLNGVVLFYTTAGRATGTTTITETTLVQTTQLDEPLSVQNTFSPNALTIDQHAGSSVPFGSSSLLIELVKAG